MSVQRGQAIIETAIFLPVALLTLFTVIWASQYGVMSVRVQSSLRYSGLVSNQVDPFQSYSMYALYNSLGAYSTNSPIPTSTCDAPTTDALTNSGTYPGPTSAPYWLATPAAPTVNCSNTNSQTAMFTNGVTQTVVALSNVPSVTAATKVPGYLTKIGLMGATQPTTATLNFLKPADMLTLMTCHSGMQQVIGASLAPTPPPGNPSNPTALSEPIPAQTAIPVTSC